MKSTTQVQPFYTESLGGGSYCLAYYDGSIRVQVTAHGIDNLRVPQSDELVDILIQHVDSTGYPIANAILIEGAPYDSYITQF